MTNRKAITPAMKIDCLLWIAEQILCDPIFCPECSDPILPRQRIEWDHRHAIVHGGPHEYQNLRPIHYDPCHKKKTKRDIAANAKVKRILADKPSKRPMKSSGRKIPSRPFRPRNPT